MYKTPILFVIFCRKDIALKTLAAIRKAKPSKMYIACDGARQHVEGEAAIVIPRHDLPRWEGRRQARPEPDRKAGGREARRALPGTVARRR